jgi:hypothetical protein
MMEISGPATVSDTQGSLSLYMTLIVFKPSANSVTHIIFTYMGDYYAQISPDVKSIIESIKLIEPQ